MAKKQKQQVPLWSWDLGVTQTALSQWLSCHEQFSLDYIEGWSPTALAVPLEYGSLMHLCIERHGQNRGARGHSPVTIAQQICASYKAARRPQLKTNEEYGALELMLTTCQAQFPLYAEHWAEDDGKQDWLSHEEEFSVPYTFTHQVPNINVTSLMGGLPAAEEAMRGSFLPEKVTVNLKGIFDGKYRIQVQGGQPAGLGLLETKTRSQIDDVAIQAALRCDLQTMFYSHAATLQSGEPIEELLYNVIRRPQLRLGVRESLKDYAARVVADITKRPEYYFRRWTVSILPTDMEKFRVSVLDPALRNMLMWWESIEQNPFDRFQSPYHFVNLNALQTKYGKCRLYDLLVLGHKKGYFRRSSPFAELAAV